MNNFVPKFNIYKTPDGVVTLKSKGNTLVIAAHASISQEVADRLRIPELEAAHDAAQAPVDPLADLKPAVIAETDTDKSNKTRGKTTKPEAETPDGANTQGAK